MSRFLTMKQAAEELNVSEEWVERELKQRHMLTRNPLVARYHFEIFKAELRKKQEAALAEYYRLAEELKIP